MTARAAPPILLVVLLIAGCGAPAPPAAREADKRAARIAEAAAQPGTKSGGATPESRGPALADRWGETGCQGDCDAAEALFSADYDTCMAAAGGETVNVLDCVGGEYRRQASALEVDYGRFRAMATRDEHRRLAASQAGWKDALQLRTELAGLEHGQGTAGSSRGAWLRST